MNLHLRGANCQFETFGCPEGDRVAQVALWTEMVIQAEMALLAEVASDMVSDICVGLVQEHLYLCYSSVSVDSLLSDFGKDNSHLIVSDVLELGVFQSQHSLFYAQETQHPDSSHLCLRHNVS